MKTVLVTGAEGQLGKCLQKIHSGYPGYRFIFTSSETLDITKRSDIFRLFEKEAPAYCLNFAAYTRVEEAEKNPEAAFLVNGEGVKHLAEACKEYNTTLLHISTDYVFDGTKTTPYTEDDIPHPINEYGRSKLAGERYIRELLEKYFIVRTSWLYSEFGHNFYKTILEKAETAVEIQVTDAERGCPTDGNDLAVFLMRIIVSGYKKHGTYHFCGDRVLSWYEFARAILRKSNKPGGVKVVKTKKYHTFAKRPVYSALKPSIIRFKDEKPAK